MRTLNATLQAAMDSGNFTPIVRAAVLDPTTHAVVLYLNLVYYRINGLDIDIEFYDPSGTFSDTVSLERGALIAGVEYTIFSGIYHLTKSFKAQGGKNGLYICSGSLVEPTAIDVPAADVSYQTIINAVLAYGDNVATFKNPAAAWLAYQFYSTGQSLYSSNIYSFFAILRQKYLIYATENGLDSLLFFSVSDSLAIASQYTISLNDLDTFSIHSEYRQFQWKDETGTIHSPGPATLPMHNLGYLESTAAAPSVPANTDYVAETVATVIPNLKYQTGDCVKFDPGVPGFTLQKSVLDVTEVFNAKYDKKKEQAWYMELRPLAYFTTTPAGYVPPTLQYVANYIPLSTIGFTGNLDPTVDTLQALANTVDQMPVIKYSPAGVTGQLAQFTATNKIGPAKIIGPTTNILTINNAAAATLALAINTGKTLTFGTVNTIITIKNVYCLGDSLTGGLDAGYAYPDYLQILLGANYLTVNKGIGGQGTTLMLARQYTDIIDKGDGTFFIMLGGTNDNNYAVTESNLQAAYTNAKNAGMTVIAVTVPPHNGTDQANILAVNNWIKNVATDVDYIADAYALFNDPAHVGYLLAAYDSGDGIHPNHAGFSALATLIHNTLTWSSINNYSVLVTAPAAINQSVLTTSNPTFNNLTLSGSAVIPTMTGNTAIWGTVGIGTAADPSTLLTVYKNNPANNSATIGVNTLLVLNQTVSADFNNVAFIFYGNISANTGVTNAWSQIGFGGGLTIESSHRGAFGTVAGYVGRNYLKAGAAGSISSVYGMQLCAIDNQGANTVAITRSVTLSLNNPNLNGASLGSNIAINIDSQTAAPNWWDNFAIYTNQGAVQFGDRVMIYGCRDWQQLLVAGYTSQSIYSPVAQVTRTDGAAGITAMLGLTACGSGSNGDGGAIFLSGKSSTSTDQAMGMDQWYWVDATHASRKARRVFNVYDISVREAIRFEATGSAAAIGFFGAAAVAQQGATTDLGTVLSNLGLRTAGTAYPITTSGAVTLTGEVLCDTNSFKVDVAAHKVGIGSLMATGGVSYYKANLNGTFLFLGTDSSSESPIFKIIPTYINSTHSTYTTTTQFVAYDSSSEYECFRFDAVAEPRIGYFGHAASAQQTGVAVTAAGIHAALVAYGLITA